MKSQPKPTCANSGAEPRSKELTMLASAIATAGTVPNTKSASLGTMMMNYLVLVWCLLTVAFVATWHRMTHIHVTTTEKKLPSTTNTTVLLWDFIFKERKNDEYRRYRYTWYGMIDHFCCTIHRRNDAGCCIYCTGVAGFSVPPCDELYATTTANR